MVQLVYTKTNSVTTMCGCVVVIMINENVKAEDFEECQPDDRPHETGYLFNIEYPKELNELLLGSNKHRISITYYDFNKGSINDPNWFTYSHVNGGYQAHHWSVTKGKFDEFLLKAVAHELFAEDYRYVQSAYNLEDGRA
tara:strand:- start:7335 stop:7754 length:420 start_codon:yes stop_codon:yes gene_type:complete